MQTVFSFINPSEKDLLILGELISIEILPFSFCVKWQLQIDNMPLGLVVHQTFYPIAYLGAFFKLNGSIDQQHYCHRPLTLPPAIEFVMPK